MHNELNELLISPYEDDNTLVMADSQTANLRFNGPVDNTVVINSTYSDWSQHYLIDVVDEVGAVVKLHESMADLTVDIEAFIKLINRN